MPPGGRHRATGGRAARRRHGSYPADRERTARDHAAPGRKSPRVQVEAINGLDGAERYVVQPNLSNGDVAAGVARVAPDGLTVGGEDARLSIARSTGRWAGARTKPGAVQPIAAEDPGTPSLLLRGRMRYRPERDAPGHLSGSGRSPDTSCAVRSGARRGACSSRTL